LHGKAMSYNNYVDADAARRAAYDFAEPCVAIIKHSNPCGIAVGTDLADAHAKANACDPVSAFGGVIAANGPVTAALARQIKDVFTEVVIAPEFDAEALDILSASKNVRLVRCPGGYGGVQGGRPPEIELRPVTGPRARSRPATPTSRSPTASRSWPRPACAPWPNPAARSATTWSSRPPRPRASRCTSPAYGTSTTKGTDVTAQVLDGKALAAE